jgi:hypothetical protein
LGIPIVAPAPALAVLRGLTFAAERMRAEEPREIKPNTAPFVPLKGSGSNYFPNEFAV